MVKKLIYKIKELYQEVYYYKCSVGYKKLVLMILKNIFIILTIAYVFYDNLWFSFLLLPVLLFFLTQSIRDDLSKESEKTLEQFQDMLTILSQNLQAGVSIEKAFKNVYTELSKMYKKEATVLRSLNHIVHGLEVNIPIEKLIADMATELSEEEVDMFSSVFISAKRSGGNMIDIISFTTSMLIDKVEIKRETDVIIAAKRTEQRIMNIVPLGIILYIRLCSGEFIESLYHSFAGVFIMSALLLVYILAYVWSERILKIEV